MMNTIEFQQRQRFTKNKNKFRGHEQNTPGLSTILNQYYAENKKYRQAMKHFKRMGQVEKNPLIRDIRNEVWEDCEYDDIDWEEMYCDRDFSEY